MNNTLMNNPYAWAFLSLCTIASLLFSIYTWFIGKKVKEISIDYFMSCIIKQRVNAVSKLDIKFDGKYISDLSSTMFYIWNSGNDVINADDIVKKGLMKIQCGSKNILDAKIIKQSDIDNNFSIMQITSNDIDISFEYMDSNDGVVVQILHTGDISEIKFDCKIKGGNPIRNNFEVIEKRFWRKYLWTFIVIFFIIAILLYICYIPFIPNLLKNPSFYEENFLFFLPITIIGVVLFVTLICSKIIKRIGIVFRKTIPDTLK